MHFPSQSPCSKAGGTEEPSRGQNCPRGLEGDNSPSWVFLKTLATKLSTTKHHRDQRRLHQQGLLQDGLSPAPLPGHSSPAQFLEGASSPECPFGSSCLGDEPGDHSVTSQLKAQLAASPRPTQGAEGRNVPSCHALVWKGCIWFSFHFCLHPAFTSFLEKVPA